MLPYQRPGIIVILILHPFLRRRDFFDARGIPVPATWEEVVEIAERYNGTDLDGSGRGAWGFCMPRQPSEWHTVASWHGYTELIGAFGRSASCLCVGWACNSKSTGIDSC